MSKASPVDRLPFQQVDDFRLDKLLYQGQHTLVYRAAQLSLDRAVVVKLLKDHIARQPEWTARFRREAKVCAHLKHAHIVDVYALGEKEGYQYIVNEFIDGPSVKELLKNCGPLPLPVALSITDHILQALQFAHRRGIIHRDVKPANILINTQGYAKLADFGLAQIGEEPTVTQQGSIVGTPAYMAPEQITGQPLQGQADLFALGAVLYEMLSGRQAFGGENYSACIYKVINEEPPPLRDFLPDLPGTWIEYVGKFLQKSPQDRWESAQAAREALLTLAAREGIELGPRVIVEMCTGQFVERAAPLGETAPDDEALPGRSEPARSAVPAARRKWVGYLGGIAGAVLATLLFLWFYQAADSRLSQKQGMATPGISVDEKVLPDSAAVAASAPGESSDSIPPENPPRARPIRQKAGKLPQQVEQEDSLLPEATNLGAREAAELPPVSPPPETSTRAYLQLRVEPWAEVQIDGQPLDSHLVQRTLELAPGRRTVTLLHPSFSPRVFQLNLRAGEEHRLEWSFLATVGYLWVEARPWAEIYINNKLRDSTPLEHPIVLPAGRYFLELKHPLLMPHRQYIRIQARDTLRIQTVLKKQ